ncbi:MAG: NUDIX domain-containing protein [Oceanicaulis sp.]|jgi:8-oxo-dGTP pyrophosphatase MutT (NUDIX family)|nr:NUDIX domain-containing protein [Oceanicaulis sp.]
MPDAKNDKKTTPKTSPRPKLASSLLLRRKRANGEIELLFGRRSTGHVFMPKKYVFPGGRVDPTDGFAPLAEELNDKTRSVMTRVLTERRARAAAAAALRETAEETGLILGKPVENPCNFKAPWAPFEAAGAAPNAAPLEVITRAITPPKRPRRFDAWFFTCDVEHVHGPAELTSNGELEDLKWVSLDDRGTLDLPIATQYVIGELETWLKDPARPIRFLKSTRSGPQVETL